MPEQQELIGDEPKRKHGRKLKGESRSMELRQKLIVWKQTPESLRPSLRALARELGTSYQLLKHYLDGLEEWGWKERRRNAKKESEEIQARAKAEGREMTLREAVRAIVYPGLLNKIASLKRDAKRGPLNRHQIKMLKMLAGQFPEAQAFLQKYSQYSWSEKDVAKIAQEKELYRKTKLEEVRARATAMGHPLTPQAERRYLAWLEKE